jgi:hypothetical protein
MIVFIKIQMKFKLFNDLNVAPPSLDFFLFKQLQLEEAAFQINFIKRLRRQGHSQSSSS